MTEVKAVVFKIDPVKRIERTQGVDNYTVQRENLRSGLLKA